MSKRKSSHPPQPIWKHSKSDETIVAFCAGRDVEYVPPCDEDLVFEDIATNEASLLALVESKSLKKSEAAQIAKGLLVLRAEIEGGGFFLDPRLEDVHINIESALAETVGSLAGKIHAGRSRNDQVACDLRLYHRSCIFAHVESLLITIEAFLDLADREKETLAPGFSHHQRAFVTTWGHQLASYASAWLRDVERGFGVLERINRCPLGAAAGFGTSWPLDRGRIAKLLGFDGIVENSLDAVSSRLEVEQDIVAWLALWMNHASTVAQDLILYSMEEFRWIRLAPETTTGSSIMPQKRNPDFAEVIKGKTALVHGALASLLSLGKGQPSGYHRDSQYSKPIGQDVWREIWEVPDILQTVMEKLKVDRKIMLEATQGGFLEAAEWADAIAQVSGLPFRDLYSAIGTAVNRCRKKGRLDRATVNKTLREQKIDFQVSATLAKALSSPKDLVARRKTLGSPNPAFLVKEIERKKADLDKMVKELNRIGNRVEKAERERSRLIASLAGA
jgi:argininosuccinate lyase